jgi:hypothetical protein
MTYEELLESLTDDLEKNIVSSADVQRLIERLEKTYA